jgi:cysteinyl-tRNA synthetase
MSTAAPTHLTNAGSHPSMSAAAKPEIRIYNTLSKTKEVFAPLRPPVVGMYLCGPTVYAESHIGHMVGPVVFDTVKRFLTYCGYEVNFVVNITDVDDKLINKSRQRGIPMSQVATEMTADYLANLKELGVTTINHLPRATDHIQQIIDFIKTLVDKGYAYAVDGDVFFDVMCDPNYGQLSNRSVDDQMGEGGDAASKKRSAGDFALWKSAPDSDIAWDSPWGKGRPGWHIECSAMSHEILGETFDIHGGGLDLMFPHHENERAQSSCCHGKPMVKYWMHNGLMRAGEKGKVGGKSDREPTPQLDPEAAAAGKISRSKGAGGLARTIRRHTGERIRFFLLRTHYRSTIVYDEDGLNEAGAGLDSFYRYFDRFNEVTSSIECEDFPKQLFFALKTSARRESSATLEGDDALLETCRTTRTKFLSAMDDDFNTGAALSHLFDLLKSLNRFADENSLTAKSDTNSPAVKNLIAATTLLRELSGLLGLFQKPVEKVGGNEADASLLDSVVHLLINMRREARERKDYAAGDLIRNRLTELGVALLDKKEGTTWERT